jgi:hypothetical protein
MMTFIVAPWWLHRSDAFGKMPGTWSNMKLPRDAIISLKKIRNYLLTWRAKGDKSHFLGLAGYTRGNPWQLERDLREQILGLEAEPLPPRGYGDRFEVRGPLRGPNGTELLVRTIWMRELHSGAVKFITLIPLGRPEP